MISMLLYCGNTKAGLVARLFYLSSLRGQKSATSATTTKLKMMPITICEISRPHDMSR